ncbi:MAG TPA: acetyl-CoA C-acyltransferase [Planctomycetota bacterium]|nr:acetyl-CoA C-acyltransferase [Planctomycetota bacterium]
MTDKDIVLINGARTAWAEYSGTPGFGMFRDVSCVDLGATAARAAIERSGAKAEWIDHVIFGNAMQTSSDAIYGARHVGLKAGCRIETPALTINRLCGSGIESVALAGRFLALGEASWVLAGGMESMSQAPYIIRGMRGETPRFGSELKIEDSLFVNLKDGYCGLFMAETAQNCAKKYSITRQAQDEYALRSHLDGAKAVKDGLFKEEIVPVVVKRRKEEILFASDDHIKPETTIEKLAALPPAFGRDGTVTAGNASGIVDGAASIVVTTAVEAAAKKVQPLGRVIGTAAVGVPPELMGMGPAPAIRAVLQKAKMKLQDIDLFEINEAFAGQYLAVEKELKLDRQKVNVNGGSIALGHPLAATGTRLILTLLYELRRRRKKFGIASACIGGGQGIAMIVEYLG